MLSLRMLLSVPCMVMVLCLCRYGNAQGDSIGFPEENQDPSIEPADKRKPLFMPGTCPENELFYAGDQTDDRVCDCKPAYVYHPDTEKCQPAFRQGPCAKGQILVLREDSFIPICVVNICSTEGKVLLADKGCVKLGSPCLDHPLAEYGVNATTIKVQCLKNPRFEKRIDMMMCPPGCKRHSDGKCPEGT